MNNISEAYKALSDKYEQERKALDIKFATDVKELLLKELAKLDDGEEAAVDSHNCDGFGIATGTYSDAFNRIDKNGGILVYNNNECEGSLAYGPDKTDIFNMPVEIQLEALNSLIHYNNKKQVTGEDVLNWHGSDHSIEELADVVAEILNGEYSTAQARKDVLNSRD